ncbi:MAG: FimV/HubP family polar landmark protein [Oleiphilaceae bacterium]|nr:FimV/HubP family polar landmark protein [Oleiphilaceae bacterium]
MIRKLAVALSFLSAGFSGLVFALGLGEVSVQSALNQPLKAEIELVNVGDLEAAEILPGLATREEFIKAGVDRVYFLSDIRFSVKQGANGKLAVELTTNKPVREPYLNFLVEVIWPSGRLLREYALLIDPPLFAEEQPAVVAAPAPATSAPAVTPQAQRPGGDTVTVSRQAVTATPATVTGGTYGPTDSSDTLWEIAMKARPDRSVSPQQVMLAIQDLNPEAFIDNNINKLKAGQILRLPSKQEMQSRSVAEAINEVIAQNEALQPRKRKAVASSDKVQSAPVTKPASKPTLSSSDELKLVVAESGNDSTVAGAGQGVSGGSGTGDTQTETELALALEKLDKASIENRELNSRVGDLEEQLETLQRLLTLKNDQLASIQEQMRANEMARLEAEQGAAAEADATGTMERVIEEGPDMVMDSSTEMEQAEAEVAPKPEPEPKPEPKPVAPVADAPLAADEQSGRADTERNIIETILNNPLYLGLAGVAIIILLVLLWMLSRHNAAQEQALRESMLEPDDAPDQPDSVSSVFDDEQQSNEVFAAEEGAEQLEQEEALYPDEEMPEAGSVAGEQESGGEQEDVVAEADVYIAYGRLDQAATILEEAISREPVRTDYRLKLLEVYKEAGNSEAFDKQYGELEAIQDQQALEQANQIRAEMTEQDLSDVDEAELALADEVRQDEEVRDSEIAAEEGLAAEEEVVEAELDTAADNDFSLDTVENIDDEEEVELDVDLSSEELDLDVDVDIDLESTADLTDDALELDADLEADLDAELDADLEDNSLDAAIDKIDQDLSADLDLELDDIDLSDELEQESEIDLPDDLSIPEELTSIDEPLEDDGEIAEAVEEVEAEVPEAPDTVVSDDILEEAVEALGDPDSFEPELGEADDFDFLKGTDEASTKLDLARAYIDMGDVDGARDILQEVEAEGSPEQQTEAKELLQSLG